MVLVEKVEEKVRLNKPKQVFRPLSYQETGEYTVDDDHSVPGVFDCENEKLSCVLFVMFLFSKYFSSVTYPQRDMWDKFRHFSHGISCRHRSEMVNP